MAGQDPNVVASNELPKWVKSDGETLQDLVNRRRIEEEVFQRPSSVQVLRGGAEQFTLFLLDTFPNVLPTAFEAQHLSRIIFNQI